MAETKPPRWFKLQNKFVMAVQKLGIPTGPIMVLTVPGRKTGQPRSTPMTPFTLDDQLYTVAGYPSSEWARNARAAGSRAALRRATRAERGQCRGRCGAHRGHQSVGARRA